MSKRLADAIAALEIRDSNFAGLLAEIFEGVTCCPYRNLLDFRLASWLVRIIMDFHRFPCIFFDFLYAFYGFPKIVIGLGGFQTVL